MADPNPNSERIIYSFDTLTFPTPDSGIKYNDNFEALRM